MQIVQCLHPIVLLAQVPALVKVSLVSLPILGCQHTSQCINQLSVFNSEGIATEVQVIHLCLTNAVVSPVVLDSHNMLVIVNVRHHDMTH